MFSEKIKVFYAVFSYNSRIGGLVLIEIHTTCFTLLSGKLKPLAFTHRKSKGKFYAVHKCAREVNDNVAHS